MTENQAARDRRAAQDSQARIVFECPKCGFWRGESEGVWSKPQHCSRCIDRIVAAKPWGARGHRTVKDVQSAPMMVAVEVEAVDYDDERRFAVEVERDRLHTQLEGAVDTAREANALLRELALVYLDIDVLPEAVRDTFVRVRADLDQMKLEA